MFKFYRTPDNEKYQKLFDKMAYGFIYLQMVYDRDGKPADCIFLEMNRAFYEVLGNNYGQVLGKRLSEVAPGIWNSTFDWFGTVSNVAATGDSKVFSRYITDLDKWLEISVFSDRRGFFGVTVHEVTQEKSYLDNLKLLNNSLIGYIQFPPSCINFRMITDDLLKLSGAKYTYITSLNSENTQVTIEALSGENNSILRASKLLGFNPVGSTWRIDEDYLREVKVQKLWLRALSNNIFTSVIPLPLLKYLKKLFNLGDFWAIGLFHHNEILGAITMIMPPGKTPAFPELIELFSQQVSMVILRYKAEKELKETKERLQFALEGSGDGIWDWNLRTNEEIFSDKYKEIIGYDSHEDWNNYDDWGSRVHPDDLDAVMDAFARYMKGETDNYCSEYRMRCKDGRYKWILARGKINSWDEDGKPLRMVGTLKDMSESKKTEEELKKAKEEAEILSQEKSEYLANMSHELRTPLNVILGAVQLLDMYLKADTGFSPDKAKKHLRSMNQNCLRLLRLINNLIDTTKIDAGFYKINLLNQDIVNIVEGIATSVIEYFQQKNINLLFRTDTKAKIIACDVDMIERVILNLLSNAFKFTNPEGLITVSINDGDEWVSISVKDNGIGIPKDKQEIIFERYKQVDKLLTREHEGSGIGLSLSKSLVELHGGRISVKSEYGEGSEFLVELPVKSITDNSARPVNSSYLPNNKRLVERMNVEFADIYK